MEDKTIIKLSTNTKIQYSLFNFFFPIVIITALIYKCEAYSIYSTYISAFSILLGLFLLIYNYRKYKQFLLVDDSNIMICQGKTDEPKIIEIIPITSDIKISISDFIRLPIIKYMGKNKDLMHTNISIFCLILGLPLSAIFIGSSYYIAADVLQKLKIHIDESNIIYIKKIKPWELKLTNIFIWLYVIYVCFFGILGIISMPFFGAMETI